MLGSELIGEEYSLRCITSRISVLSPSSTDCSGLVCVKCEDPNAS